MVYPSSFLISLFAFIFILNCPVLASNVDYQKSTDIETLHKAALQHDVQAQAKLRDLYAKKQGIFTDPDHAFQEYQRLAKNGDLIAATILGWMYRDGRGANKDAQKAFKLYFEAAKQGYAMAQNNLGNMYANGQGVDKDEKEAVKWYKKAADQELEVAQYNLGKMYENGRGVTKNGKKAVTCYKKAADQGYIYAQYWLGRLYQAGRCVNKDEKEAVKWYKKAADQGDAQAQYRLGWMYEDGDGVDKDAKEAVKWYKKAADQGDAQAQYRLGVMYENGQGVDKDKKEAVTWYTKAADQELEVAQYNLGKMYENGRGVTKNGKKAVTCYKKAADQGYIYAQYWLGRLYQAGRCVNKDEKEAVKWYKKAADQGDANSQSWLGWMYENGYGVDKDEKEAVKWYKKAADQGDANSQYRLGLMYEHGQECLGGMMFECGQGVDKDSQEAAKWYRKAAEIGHPKARTRLNAINKIASKLLTEQQGIILTDKEISVISYISSPSLKGAVDSTSSLAQGKEKSLFKHPRQVDNQDTSENFIQSPAKRQKADGRLSFSESLATSLETILHEKDSIKAQLKENNDDYTAHYKLASLYEQISALSSFQKRMFKYFEKAVKKYQLSAEHDCQEAQAALRSLRDKGAYSNLDNDAMDWYKKAVTQAGMNFQEFISIFNTTLSNNNNAPNSRVFLLQLSAISFIDLDDDRFLPASVEWGGSPKPQEPNYIYMPLYNSNKYGRYEDAIMAIDPSGDGEDETAYCVAKRYGDLYFITALGGFAGGYEENPKNRMGNSIEVLEKLTNIAITHKVNYVLIEKNNDNSYASLLRSALGKDREIIKWHHSQKKEKRIVETFKPLLDNHQLVIDRKVLKDDFESKPSNDIKYKFFYQLTHMTLDEERWSTKKSALPHDDRLDAAAMAIKHLRVRKEKLKDSEYVHEVVR